MKFPARPAQRVRNSYDENIKSPIYFPRHHFIDADKMRATAVKTPLKLHSTQPLYKQIEGGILQCLAEGEWKPGDQLPTESDLAKRFGVAIFTVRAGIGELVDAGILARKQGKGTFVARHERDRTHRVLAKIFDHENRKVIPTRQEVTFFRKELADERTRSLLSLDRRQKSQVYNWEVVVEVDGRAICVRRITVPAGLFPGLTGRVLRANRHNLYALYQDLCGVNIIRLEDRVYSIKADPRMAGVLRMKSGDPLLKINRVAFTYNAVPVEIRTHYYDSARYHYCADQPAL
jgi:GntR family transcriptional regulator